MTTVARELNHTMGELTLGYMPDAREVLGGAPVAKNRACITSSWSIESMKELVRASILK